MASQQQPPYPMQSRPPVPSSPMGGPPPTGYRPPVAGAVPGQQQPQPQHPGMPYRTSGTPPPGSPMMRPPPGIRPGMLPPQQQQQQRPPQPGMPMTPPLANTVMYQQQSALTGSPVPQPRTPPVLGATTHSTPGSPPPVSQSPTISAGSSAPQSPITEQHHRTTTTRKRMYPDQITKAYMDQPAGQIDSFSSPGFQQQPQQQQQFQQHSPVPTMTAQTYPGNQQSQFQQPMGGQVNALTGQFGNMNVSSPQGPAKSIPLLGAAPIITDLNAPAPPIILPQNSSITNSPYANAEESYKCCTINAIPANESVLKKSKLPLALVLAPYRTSEGDDDQVPVIADSVIARCRRCRTYINPFVTFVEGGQRWKCNLCFLLNDVPAAFDYDAQTQQPVDRWKRAELNYSCVEYVAPTEYMVRPPQAPAYIFIIDVSYSAVQSGMVATAARTILDSLDRIPNEQKRTQIGFITVDSSLHFYNLNASVSEPQMLVVSELDDVFLPTPAHLMVNLSDSRELIQSFLEKLPDMFKETANVNNALGTALQAAFKIVSPFGGKIVCLQSTLPNMGTGALKVREDPKVIGTAKETPLLNASSPFFKSFAVDCSRSQVSCDMLIFGGQYADVATLGCLPRFTGGQTYYYPGFHASRTEDATKFAHEFSELIAEQIGLEAVLRVRASRNLRMSGFHGNFFIRSTDLLALPNVPRNQNYVIEVAIEDELRGPTACFQTALLHTTCYGERRIRVVTLCLPVTNSVPEIIASVNPRAIVSYLANKAIERGITSKLEDARDAVVNKTIDILGAYKSHVLGLGKGSSSPQLTVPDHLKLLPLLALGLIKNDAISQTTRISTDARSNAINLIRTMPIQLLIPYLYPNLYALHSMPPEVGEISEKGVVLPTPLNLTTERLEPHGCYLLENGQDIFIWVGRGVVPQLCVDLFGLKSYDQLHSGKMTLPVVDTPINKKTNLLIGKIREMRRGNYYPAVYTVKEDSDPSLRLWFLSHLVEDRGDSTMSYQQFLQLLKDRVNAGSF
ncbi:hypothetical protein INT45_001652 [Circinella minor]|uniref:Uncharacterized protein n=1 Tax=Circinella minor TaxID=1195481 RepID=A0A8H7S6B9_9FUNG|nr:hypothetical protein INT45_001652 [Circinella minor]